METARDTANRVVNRLLGEDCETKPQPKASDTAVTPHHYAPVRPRFEAKTTSVKKAFKSGKSSSGKSVAGKPGKVSYRESLVRSVMEKIKMKKAGKGKPVAKAPGTVSYKKENVTGAPVTDATATLAEKMGSGIKGGKAKKLLSTIAKKPGSVGYGKK